MKTIVLIVIFGFLVSLSSSRSAIDKNEEVARDVRDAGPRKKKLIMKKKTKSNKEKMGKNLRKQKKAGGKKGSVRRMSRKFEDCVTKWLSFNLTLVGELRRKLIKVQDNKNLIGKKATKVKFGL